MIFVHLQMIFKEQNYPIVNQFEEEQFFHTAVLFKTICISGLIYSCCLELATVSRLMRILRFRVKYNMPKVCYCKRFDKYHVCMVLELGCSDSTQDGDEWKCLVFGFLAVLVKYFINCFILWQITNLYLFVFLLVWIGSAAPISFNRLHPRSDQLAPLLSRPER